MGALPEREWIPRAPSLRRKLSLTAKVQDEVGHGQILYRIAEDLGKSRDAMFEDLINARTKFHNVFHYPTESWGDVVVIGFLIDGAALVTQRALLDSSYAPYVRAMRRICAEESMHLRHGEDMLLELASGTKAQRAMFQDAVDRWWRPIMHFYGPPSNPDKDVLLYWGIKTKSNEELRSEFFDTYVPKLWDLGFTVPDPDLRYGPGTKTWTWGSVDWANWDEFWQVVRGNGPMTETRLSWRRAVWDNHAWLRDVFAGIPRQVA
jgi:ring-1,2-phenylacetyl-CoA epoxidase subunit PaaA